MLKHLINPFWMLVGGGNLLIYPENQVRLTLQDSSVNVGRHCSSRGEREDGTKVREVTRGLTSAEIKMSQGKQIRAPALCKTHC